MSKVVMGNGGIMVARLSLLRFQRGGRKQHKLTRIHDFFFIVAESPWNLIKQGQTRTTHNASRHCRVRFYMHFCGATLVETARYPRPQEIFVASI